MKLGKLQPRHDSRTLQFADYISTSLPQPADSLDGTYGVTDWGVMLNDQIGDCAVACPGHMVMPWTKASSGIVKKIPDEEILKAYSDISGYDPNTGRGDNGCVVLDVLNYWRNTGIGNDKLGAYAELEPNNHDHVKLSLSVFGGTYLGINLPRSAQSQVGGVWTVSRWFWLNRPGSWGGHAVPVVSYDSRTLTVVTWGKLQKMTWQFFDKYTDEAYVCLSPDWLKPDGKSVSGFDKETLLTDLEALKR